MNAERPIGLSRYLRPDEGWIPFALIALASLVTVSTVEDAKWVKEMPSLSGMALGALITGYVLSRVRVPAVLLHPVGAVIGLLVIGWQAANAASGDTFGARAADAAQRLSAFVAAAQTGMISVDGLPFAVQVLFFTWIVGYLAAWFLYRHHNAWLALIPPGVALLVNLTYLPGRFGGHFLIWVLTALLLVMVMHAVELRHRWRRAGVPAEEMPGVFAAGPMIVVAGALLAGTFWSPVLEQSLQVTVFWEQATTPWRSVEREFDRLFASVSSGRVAPLHTFGRSMPFRGAVNFGDQLPFAGRFGPARDVVMNVQAEDPGYWRAESYDSYTGQGWVTTERVSKAMPQDTVPGAVEEFKDRRPYTHTFELNLPMDVLFARGLPIYGSGVANGETARPASFTLYTEGSRNRNLAPDLQGAARDLFQSLQGRSLPDRNEIQRRLPPDLRLRRPLSQGTQIEAVEVTRTESFPPDYSSVRPLSTLPRGHKYTVTSSVSTATVEALQQAGANYPGWVRDQYLSFPDKLPERVRALAREWTQDSKNPYDMAWAIETRLRDIKYNTNIPPPPRDGDGVEYFLFSLQRGYADYYASAMAVLLRTLGIPTRVSVGYVAGEWDTEQEYYVVRETHAHAWTEVFFPGYGWIEFNPSPNWPTVPRSFSSNPVPSDDDEFLDDEGLDMPLEDEDLGSAGSVDVSGETGPTVPQWVFLLMGVVAGTGAIGGLLRILWLRGLSRLSFPAATYEKMCRVGLLARVAPRRQQTPWEYARTLVSVVPEAEPSIRAITGGYTRAVYGHQAIDISERVGLNRAWAEVRRRLLLRALRPR